MDYKGVPLRQVEEADDLTGVPHRCPEAQRQETYTDGRTEGRMETYTVAEAARLTGRSEKAIRNLCDRQRLRFTVRNGRRHILAADLHALPQKSPSEAQMGHEAEGGTSEAIPALLDRLQEQAEEIGRLRAITVQADSLRDHAERVEADLVEARATIAALEARIAARPRRWPFRRSP